MYYRQITESRNRIAAETQRGPGLTVTELNRMISEVLKAAPGTRNVTVTAEVSGFKHYISSGHWYFSLKDAESAVSCVMFRQNTLTGAQVRPADGDSVTVTGYVDVYSRDGRMQLYVTTLRPAGSGSLLEQFEALKRKLAAEGLFDPSRKRVLPMRPRRVAVITSASGAALHDILNVSGMRDPSIPVVLVPSGVQGASAAGEILAALKKAERLPDVDVIILARGGGSPEDLWCFNDEALARAVAACPIPTVSGVGHEIDFTLCDYAADVRASTPSNAAEIVFPDRKELRHRVALMRSGLGRSMSGLINTAQLGTAALRQRLQRSSPERKIHDLAEQAQRARGQLTAAIGLQIETESGLISRLRLEMGHRMERRVEEAASRAASLRTGLKAVSPLGVLERGYALVYNEERKLVTGTEAARRTREMHIRFADGEIPVTRKELDQDGTGNRI